LKTRELTENEIALWYDHALTVGYLNVRCPVCGRKIAVGEPRQYETLGEHVSLSWEECEPPYRLSLECANEKCRAFGNGFWSSPSHGEWYGGGEARDIPRIATSGYLGDDRLMYFRGRYIGKNPVWWVGKVASKVYYRMLWRVKDWMGSNPWTRQNKEGK
jgi:hypothetical protein